jgi:branched-subunit amino acid transport protein
MQNKFTMFNKQFVMGQSYIRLLIIIFVVAFLAKGGVLFRGYAIDDYKYIFGIGEKLELFFSQGRYIMAAVVWGVDLFGANMSDIYFLAGLVTLFLQAAFVVSIMRFVGMADSPSAGIVGAIMIAHPYLTEIFTFRVALPFYSVALIFSIIGLEMAAKTPATWRTRGFSLLATFAMLLTYQSFLNYFAVAIIFALFFGRVLHNKNDQSLATNNVYRERAIALAIISTISVITFLITISLTKTLGLTTRTGRATFIAIDKIPERIEQLLSSFMYIYWSAEPVFSGWLKTLVALMLVLSIAIIFRHLLTGNRKDNYVSNIFFTCCSSRFHLELLSPLGIGGRSPESLLM